MSTQQAVAEQLICAMFNLDLAIEPEGLPEFDRKIHGRFLGELPRELQHVFVAVNQLNQKLFAFSEGHNEEITEACRLFEKDVAYYFDLPEGTEFQVLIGFEVATLKKPETIIVHDDPCSF